MKELLISLRFVIVFTVLLGLGYPLVVTVVGQVAFPAQANGSLVQKDGKVVGSTLIGQDFSASVAYFQGRPSASGDHAYNPMASGGSNLTVVGKPFQDNVTAALRYTLAQPRLDVALISYRNLESTGVLFPNERDVILHRAGGHAGLAAHAQVLVDHHAPFSFDFRAGLINGRCHASISSYGVKFP